jgi:serine/threonine-protein kinase
MAAVAAERNLLFGLLALQIGLIDQGQLVAAFQAWTRDKSRALADHLAGRGDLDADDRSAVEALVARHIKKHGGDVERSLGAIPVGRSTRESLAQVGDFEVEASLGDLGPASTQAGEDRDRTASYSVGTATSDGQRFRVLRPHARGGLGAVFVALDTELHREVALKQILDRHADDAFSRQRFVAEAEITGGLEHPGIVPVYGLGTYPDGRPYYAMRFIRGDSLKEAIAAFHAEETLKRDLGRRSLELRKLLRRFLDVCNAIDYAHARGVIHRDLKPANIILGRHGETLVVDWGLAKAVGRVDPSVGEATLVPSSSGGSAETAPGSALGTPAYMSPEQAVGDLDRLGPRSDVYSLGATLYCLLTGEPPFEDADVGAILRSVQGGTFARPSQVDPSIDPALEAICLKAMALEPEGRYATPKALADDLERWMVDEPVTAWHEPLSRRLHRWSRRNRTAVTAAAATLLAALLGLGAVAGVQAQANAELRSLNGRLEGTNAELAEEKSRVQQRFDLAMRAIRTFHTGVSEDFLLKEDKFKDLRDKLLKSAADFYDKLGALLKQRSDHDSRRALAQAEFELAELTSKVADPKGAVELHREALGLREALAAEEPANVECVADVGRSLVAIGRLQEAVGQTAEALDLYRASQRRLASLAEAHPTVPARRADLAAAEHALGLLLERVGQWDEALHWLERTCDARVSLWAQSGFSDPASASDLAESHHNIGRVLWRTGSTARGLESVRTALKIRKRLVEADPTSIALRYALADSLSETGSFLISAGQDAEALESLTDAVKNFQLVVKANPAVATFQAGLAFVYIRICQVFSFGGRLADALEPQQRAVDIYRNLAESNPSMLEYQTQVATAYGGLSEIQAKLGLLPEAMASARQGVAFSNKLVATNPERPQSHERLANALMAVGRVEQRLGRQADAASSLRAAIAAIEAIPATARHPETIYNIACGRSLLAIALARSDKASGIEARAEADRAMAELQSAVALGYRTLEGLRNDTDLDAIRPRPDFQLLLLDLAFPAQPFAPSE